MLSLLVWLPLCVVAWSFIEYVLHRWPMHSRFLSRHFPVMRRVLEAHAGIHHGRYFRRDFAHDDDPAARHLNIDLHWTYNVGLSAWIWVPLLFVAPVGGVVFAAVAAAHAIAWTLAHREMHDPQGSWLRRTRYYRYIEAYHHTHHLHPNSNFNVVFPGMDWLFGTYREPVPPVPGQP